jgi:hypothetical protein
VVYEFELPINFLRLKSELMIQAETLGQLTFGNCHPPVLEKRQLKLKNLQESSAVLLRCGSF